MGLIFDEIITDRFILREGYVFRDGFVFTFGQKNPVIFDRLVIRTQPRAHGNEPRWGYSHKTLDEHIELINLHQIERVAIICDDLSFILQCPSVSDVDVYPSYYADESFDYSPLYQMPNLRYVNCKTVYGPYEQYKKFIDYSNMQRLEGISMVGESHVGYETIPTLQKLWISGNKKHKCVGSVTQSAELKQLTLLSCGIQTLDGLERCPKLESLVLYHNRSLKDIASLSGVSGTLKELVIEDSSKISDFSVLECLTSLEHLQLYGNNMLLNLDFLRNMTSLRTFTFTMDVKDGDLSLCMNLPYASCKNRKHFNLKDSQLPKKF